jgi:hypothetical protein
MLPNYLKIVKPFVSVFLNLPAETPARISPKENSGANGKFLPKPLLFHLRHPNSKKNEPKFWQILSPKNSFAKTSSTELALEFRQFLLWRNPPSPATTIPKKKKLNRRQTKQNAWWRGEGGATERERRNTVVPDSILKWTLRRDGICRGAYDYISHHHTLCACDIICFGNRCEFGTIQTPIRNSKVFSVDTSGRRKAPTKDFLAGLQGNSEFLARKRAGFFRRGGGANQKQF